MEKKNKKHLLIDTYCDGGYSYKDYVEYCKDNGDEPAEENSDTYWEWISDMIGSDWDDLESNIKYSKNNGRCVVYGTLGLWDGKHTIRVKVFNTLVDALNYIYQSVDDIQAWENDGEVEVHGLHHDGTNVFGIRPINERRAGDRANCEIEEHNNPLWFAGKYPEWLF